MKRTYKDINFRRDSLERIKLCNEIIADYQAQDLRLTLRQLYYQLVSRNVITNQEKSYKALGSLISDARLAGLVDWNAIEDRNRAPIQWAEYESIKDLVESSLYRWRMPRWGGQENYVELWVEKAALAGVLEPLAAEFHVTLMVNRGYSSQSAMWESAQRFLRNATRECKTPFLFYLGDHDPSGEDMVRDIYDRLAMFGVQNLTVRKLALTWDQVQEYDPPPNPAKLSDSRAKDYIDKHGDSCWEVDALNPATLATIIRDAFSSVVDREKMDAIIDRENEQAVKLKEMVEKMVAEYEEE